MLTTFLLVWTGVLLSVCAVTFVFSLVAAGFALFGVNLFDSMEEFDNNAQRVLMVVGLLIVSNLSLAATIWLHSFMPS